jgi:hypothetical protein
MSNSGRFRRGDDPRRGPGGGSGGKKGRSGRRPNAWKQIMARCVTRESTLRALNCVLKNDKHPAFIGALRFAAEYAYGKPQENLEVNGKVGLEMLLARSWQKEKELENPDADGPVKTLHPATPTLKRLTNKT